MALFDDVTNEYHECGVDNLYMSAKICRDAYNHTKKNCMASLASIVEDYLHLLCKRNYITERSKKKYEVLSLQLSLLSIVSAHHLLLCLFMILNLLISFQWQ